MSDLPNIIEICLREREIIKRCKEQSKHDGHPKCWQCEGEGYVIEMPIGRMVDCPCKYNKEYIEWLNKETEAVE